MSQLDAEEREILEAYEDDRLEKIALSAEDVARYRAAARSVTKKEKRVNIRLSKNDLEDIQVLAMKEGVPYQTLMSSVLHKYVSGKLVPKPS